MHRLPVEFVDLPDRLRGEFCRHAGDQDIGVAGAQGYDLGIDRRIGDLVGYRPHQSFIPGAQYVAQTVDEILAEIVVLIQQRKFRIGLLSQRIFGEDLGFGSGTRREAHGPGIGLVVAPLVPVHRQEQMRHLVCIDVFDHRRIRRGAEHRKQEGDIVAFDQLAGLFDGFRRVEGVVIIDEIDLAASDTALVVDHPEIGIRAFCDGAQSRDRPAQRRRASDLKLGGGNTWGIVGAGGARAGKGDNTGRGRAGQNGTTVERRHAFLPGYVEPRPANFAQSFGSS